MAGFLHTRGATGRGINVDASGALLTTLNPADRFIYSYGVTGHPLCVDGEGNLCISVGSGLSTPSGTLLSTGSGVPVLINGASIRSLIGTSGINVTSDGNQINIGLDSNIQANSSGTFFQGAAGAGTPALTPVYHDFASDTFLPATASDVAKLGWGVVLTNGTIGPGILEIATQGTFISPGHGLGSGFKFVGSTPGTLVDSDVGLDVSNPILYVQNADTIHVLPWRAAAGSGTAADGMAISFSDTTSSALTVGTPVYYDQVSSTYVPAAASGVGTLGWGLVVEAAGTAAKIGTAGAFDIPGHGLPNGFLYVGDTAGTLTTADTGTFSNPIAYVQNANRLHVLPWRAASSGTVSTGVTASGTATASNIGAGSGIFAQKVVGDLQFKSLIAGTNITFDGTGTDLTINSTASGTATSRIEDDLTGSIDGVLMAFTLSNTPLAGTIDVFRNGVKQRAGAGNDYTVTGTTLTTNFLPFVGTTLEAIYQI